jgi:Protein of unknown function (DUF3891)
MIVRPTELSLTLITQADHAALAWRIMEHWVADGLPVAEHRAPILHAILQHDNGWHEVDEAPIRGDDGSVLDFVATPLEVRQGVWPRGVERLASNPVAAALVAEHAINIYSRYRDDEAWASFFSRMAELRARFAGVAGVSLEEIAEDYFFLRAADLISLTFCSGWTDVQQIREYTFKLDEKILTIHPDPFAGATVSLEVPGRALARREFESAADLAEAWAASSRVTVRGILRGGDLRG